MAISRGCPSLTSVNVAVCAVRTSMGCCPAKGEMRRGKTRRIMKCPPPLLIVNDDNRRRKRSACVPQKPKGKGDDRGGRNVFDPNAVFIQISAKQPNDLGIGTPAEEDVYCFLVL